VKQTRTFVWQTIILPASCWKQHALSALRLFSGRMSGRPSRPSSMAQPPAGDTRRYPREDVSRLRRRNTEPPAARTRGHSEPPHDSGHGPRRPDTAHDELLARQLQLEEAHRHREAAHHEAAAAAAQQQRRRQNDARAMMQLLGHPGMRPPMGMMGPGMSPLEGVLPLLFHPGTGGLNVTIVTNGHPGGGPRRRFLVSDGHNIDGMDYEQLLALQERVGAVSRGASNEQIAALPTTRAQPPSTTSPTAAGAQATCAVCLEDYGAGQALRTLPCLHRFHRECIDPWLRVNRCCPVCKRDIC